jgi:hypothetical protein
MQYLKTMICNIYILFFDLSFFGLGPEVEFDKAAHHLHFFTHRIWLGRTRNGRMLGPNGGAKLVITLLHIVQNGC